MAETYTLTEAKRILRQQLQDQLEAGTHCPTCDQYAKRYHRPLTSAMAYALIIVSREQLKQPNHRGWIHVENLLKNTPGIPSSVRGDFAKLKHWKLIEAEWGQREDGSIRTGYYRITPAGFDFIHGRTTVPSHVILYNNQFEGYDVNGKHISIKDALGKQFNYAEIMQGYKLPAEPQPVPQPAQLFDTAQLERPKGRSEYRH